MHGFDRRTFLKAAGAVGAATVAGVGTAKQQDAGGIPSILQSAIDIDVENGTVTLPLYRGEGPDGGAVLYVVTETTDFSQAVERGLNWAPKLLNARRTAAVQRARGRLPPEPTGERPVAFAGTVDFSAELELVPGPEGFPLDEEASVPGAVGDDAYSPLIRIGRGVVYNAPHVANDTGSHDKVVELDRENMRVTLSLTSGFYEGEEVLYISTEASVPPVAVLEGATYAPNLGSTPSPADRNPITSAREAIVPVINGPMGPENPDRQGIRSAVAGEGSPLNVVAAEQECVDPSEAAACDAYFYSPIWDVHPVVWTPGAIDAGQQTRLTSHQQVVQRFQAGQLASAAPTGPENELLGDLPALGAVVNCPLIAVGEVE